MAITKSKAPPSPRAAPAKKSAAVPKVAAGAPVATGPSPTQTQLQKFEQAVRLFSAQKLADAAEVFRVVASGPALHVADRARGYLQVCERRLAGPTLEFHTADDHFNYAVERLSARDFDKARQHLQSALELQPRADHVMYTLALSHGMAGDGSAAYENLKHAIEVDPRNRIHARQDSDFVAIAEQFPAVRRLIES